MAGTEAPTSIWMYDPSLALASLATALYAGVFAAIFYLTVIKYRAWFFTCVVFGAAVEVAGYATRIYSIKNPLEIVGPLFFPSSSSLSLSSSFL